MPEEIALLKHTIQPAADRTALTIDATARSPHPINPLLFGKFCEHLGSNIYNGMEAQILRNPTFAKWQFGGGDGYIDGGVASTHDSETISRRVQGLAERFGFPSPAPVLESYRDGAAFGWFRIGAKDEVLLSPDAGPRSGRVQRFETLRAGRGGLGQWTHLPLHRTRGYVFRMVARSTAPADVTLTLSSLGADGMPGDVLAQTSVRLRTRWSTLTGKLEILASAALKADGLFVFSVTADTPANVVLARVLLYPDDHMHGADPDVIRMLKEARLPLLRWPGGNFVSGYRWRNGVGPIDLRPTVPNPAWEGLEHNLFGTDEFIVFCREVGCEPMICVNAGDGTPEEAAAWVQYCNGSLETPMGSLRAENGHPEPYGIKYWEVGNEISGRHQVGWTTPAGNADRYLRFAEAMRAADPSVFLMGCGGPWGPDHERNRRLVLDTKRQMPCITDHILTGGYVNAQTDFNELYNAFMGYAGILGRQYRAQRDVMLSAGIDAPRLAITELQLFASLRAEDRSLREKLPTPATISEAMYLATIVNEFIRMGDFVQMITHSATVNHGGGLRKVKERVWGTPVHYAHAMLAPLGEATPVVANLSCAAYSTQTKFGLIPPLQNVPVLDVTAAVTAGGRSLIAMLVHRSANAGPIALSIDLNGFNAGAEAEIVTLAGETMSDQNTVAQPEKITPRRNVGRVSGNKLALTLPPFSLTRVTFARA